MAIKNSIRLDGFSGCENCSSQSLVVRVAGKGHVFECADCGTTDIQMVVEKVKELLRIVPDSYRRYRKQGYGIVHSHLLIEQDLGLSGSQVHDILCVSN